METSPEDRLNQLAARARKQARITLAGAFELETVPSQAPFIESWRIRIAHPNSEWIVLRVKSQFPLELPTVFVEDLSLYGRIPHIDQGGELCYCDKSTSTYRIEDIKAIVLWIIEECRKVLDKADGVAADDDFAVEFLSYWKAIPTFVSLLEDFETVREVDVLWLDAKRSKDFSFIACEDIENAKNWVRQSGIGLPTATGRALVMPGLMPVRPPFPLTNRELYDRVQSLDLRGQWESYVRNRTGDSLIISTVLSSRGPSVIAFTVPRVPPNPGKPNSGAVNGFRPGKHPLKLEMHGWAGSAELRRFTGERIDLARLVDRTIGQQAAGPRHLAVVGVGSIGSNLLSTLIKSHHFERVSIFDPDELAIENVLRHSLGFNYVGENKAVAMGIEIGQRCPWVQIDVVPHDVLNAPTQLRQVCESADIVVLATGNAVVERAISSVLLKSCLDGTLVFRIWFTANADQGICIRYVAGKTGCPECLDDPKGESLGAIMYEPGCSAGFSQFGGSRLERFVAVCADYVLKPEDEQKTIRWSARPIDHPEQADEVVELQSEQSGECEKCK